MGYKDWSAEDKKLFKQDVAWAVQGYKRKGEKQDASHMLRYIYDAIKRVEKAVKLFTPKRFWRHPLVSRAASSKGKTYGADTFLEVVNARSEDVQRDHAEMRAAQEAMLAAVKELAKSGD